MKCKNVTNCFLLIIDALKKHDFCTFSLQNEYACQQLRQRLDSLNPPKNINWKDLIRQAYYQQIDLCARGSDTYKIPSFSDIPIDCRVSLLSNPSKGILCIDTSVYVLSITTRFQSTFYSLFTSYCRTTSINLVLINLLVIHVHQHNMSTHHFNQIVHFNSS